MSKSDWCLYRHYSADGSLLYVGISLNALRRAIEHRKSRWWDSVAKIDIQRFPSKTKALAAERKANEMERPAFNLYRLRAEPAPPANQFDRAEITFDRVAELVYVAVESFPHGALMSDLTCRLKKYARSRVIKDALIDLRFYGRIVYDGKRFHRPTSSAGVDFSLAEQHSQVRSKYVAL